MRSGCTPFRGVTKACSQESPVNLHGPCQRHDSAVRAPPTTIEFHRGAGRHRAADPAQEGLIMNASASVVAGLGTVLGIWAHPDDEAYLSGGLMAMARDHGSRVVCVTATRGE